jgi:NDP-sugar pyrophosphorylase family protein
MKKRLTITLDEELLKRIDAGIDGVKIRNRSHAIEHLLDSAMTHAMPKKAVIFAGGRGIVIENRVVYPPMISIKGRPIMEYVVGELKRNGISEVLVTIGKGSDDLVDHFGDGSALGVRLNYIREDAQRGTEGALSLVSGLIGTSPFFALNGDHIFRLDMAGMYLQHIETRALATVALTTSISRYGMGVTRLEGLKISNFTRKPDQGREARLVNAGIYLFDPSVFGLLSGSSGRIMLEESLFPALASAGKLFGYVFSTPWYSIDNIEDINKSRKEMENVVEMIKKGTK